MKLLINTYNEPVRESWLQMALTKIPRGARILDAGAGEQKFKKFCSHLNYVAQDFAQYDGTGDSRGLQVGSWDQSRLDIVSDITAIPEPDASFDAIMCVEVLEHLPEPLLAIKEFSRLLKRGGNLILTAPFCSLTHFAPFHFYSGFNRYFYERHLPDNGFRLVELVENGNFFQFIAQEVRRIPSMAKRYAGKRPYPWEYAIIYLLLLLLERLNRRDTGSAESMHFGCFVHAAKE